MKRNIFVLAVLTLTEMKKGEICCLILLGALLFTPGLAKADGLAYGDLGNPKDYARYIRTYPKLSQISSFFDLMTRLSQLENPVPNVQPDPFTFYRFPELYIPGSFDWRNQRVVGPVGDQGSCGSCWAFATVGVIESRIAMLGWPTYNLSEQQLINCSSGSCGGGDSSALRFYHDNEPLDDFCAPYTASDTGDCNFACSSRSFLAIEGYNEEDLPDPILKSSYYTVDAGEEPDQITQMKLSILYDGPAFFRFKVYSDFNIPGSSEDWWGEAGFGEVYTQSSGTYQAGHAVLIIGWDNSKQAWLCQNSWGDDGPNNDGTFWISYAGHDHDLDFGMAGIEVFSIDDNFDLMPKKLHYFEDGTWNQATDIRVWNHPPDCILDPCPTCQVSNVCDFGTSMNGREVTGVVMVWNESGTNTHNIEIMDKYYWDLDEVSPFWNSTIDWMAQNIISGQSHYSIGEWNDLLPVGWDYYYDESGNGNPIFRIEYLEPVGSGWWVPYQQEIWSWCIGCDL